MILKRYISIVISLLTYACVFQACSDETDVELPDPETDGSRPSMTISICMDGSVTGSRGSDDDFEEGTGLENYLDLANKNFRIYFFDSDNRFLDVFVPYRIDLDGNNNVLANQSYIFYQFQGMLPESVPDRFKVVALFNWPEYPVESTDEFTPAEAMVLRVGETTIEDLCTHPSAQFAALTLENDDDEWLDTADRLIPFYGVREYDLNDYVSASDKTPEGQIKGGVIVNLSKKGSVSTPLPLLRALAKVEVILDNPLATFEEVTMTRVNRKGFCAPYQAAAGENRWKFDHTDYFPNDSYVWEETFVRGVHLPGGSNDADATRLPLKKVSDSPERWVAYVPEYKNIATDNFTSVRLKLKKPETDNEAAQPGDANDTHYYKEIYFTDGGKIDGSRHDIERNNIYRFTITGMNGAPEVTLDVQPFAEQRLNFQFGLMRDERGDLMILPVQEVDSEGNPVYDSEGNPMMTYPQYFLDFINDSNPKHKYPQEEDENGNPTTGENIRLEEGDYYAIVVGEYEEMSDAVVWVKDRDGCHVLSNYGVNTEYQECSARLVESFYGNNQSEKFLKDIFGYRRIHHFDNHNSIVRHPKLDKLLFCYIENFMQPDQVRKYYEVESWDESTASGWIVNKDSEGNETGFQEIKSDGTFGRVIPIPGSAD